MLLREDWKRRHQQVLDAGGLHVLGTERHESRRIDNQLRGRCGRQGDVGSSHFYLSLQDNLMRIFASDRVASLMKRLGMKEDEAITNPMVTKAIENAQRKVEGHNFDMRKQLLEFDDVANDQRKVIYQQRNELLESEEIGETIAAIRVDVVNVAIDQFIPPESLEEQWDTPGLEQYLTQEFGVKLPISRWLEEDETLHEETLRQRIFQAIEAAYRQKETAAGADVMRQLEKSVMLQTLDQLWKEHLAAMDLLRQGIHLRGYAQKNPKQEFKRESFEMFTKMLDNIKHDVIRMLSLVQIQTESQVQAMEEQQRRAAEAAMQDMSFIHPQASNEGEEHVQPYVREHPKVGRNEPCPCGSGKKYKVCHGRLH